MKQMQVIHPNACGIDVGSRFHVAAIGMSDNQVKEFGVYTKDNEEMIDWLKANDVISFSTCNRSYKNKHTIFSFFLH